MWRLQKLEKCLHPRSKTPETTKEKVWYTKKTFEKFPEKYDMKKLNKKEVLDNIISDFGEGKYRFMNFRGGNKIDIIDFKDIEQEGLLKEIEKNLNARRGEIS